MAFHNNHGAILYHFQANAKYWSIAIFHIAPAFDDPGLHWNIAIRFGMKKLEWCGYPMVKKSYMFSRHFDTIAECNGQMDRQTDVLRQHSPLANIVRLLSHSGLTSKRHPFEEEVDTDCLVVHFSEVILRKARSN